MYKRSNECNTCNCLFCSSLSDDVKDKFHEMGKIISYPNKTTINFENYNEVLIVKSGLMIFKSDQKVGTLMKISYQEPGDLIGMYSILYPDYYKNRNMQIKTITDVTVCALPLKTLNKMFLTNNDLCIAMIKHVLSYSARRYEAYNKWPYMSAEDKVKYFINNYDKNPTFAKLTHSDIALLTGLHRVTVTRAIKNVIKTNNNFTK
jgi:CRP-like cAMP-binding protein